MIFGEDLYWKRDFYILLRKLKRRAFFCRFWNFDFPYIWGHLWRPQVLQYMLHASLRHFDALCLFPWISVRKSPVASWLTKTISLNKKLPYLMIFGEDVYWKSDFYILLRKLKTRENSYPYPGCNGELLCGFGGWSEFIRWVVKSNASERVPDEKKSYQVRV